MLSNPITSPRQPLFTISSISSLSASISILPWLTQRTFSGISARNSSFALAWLQTMLSSTKNSSLRFCDLISLTTSSTGLQKCLAPKYTDDAQKLHLCEQPREN